MSLRDHDHSTIDALIGQTREGSDEALGELIESFRSYLLLIANQDLEPLLKTKVAASDIVQDTCAIAHRRFATFRGATGEEFKAWLAQVLRNQLSDWRRKYVRSDKRRAHREQRMPTGSGAAAGWEPADQADTPLANLIADEEAAALSTAMSHLPDDYRRVLRMRNWDLLPFEAIAARMGRSAEAVRKIWSRAVDRLHDELTTTIRSADSR